MIKTTEYKHKKHDKRLCDLNILEELYLSCPYQYFHMLFPTIHSRCHENSSTHISDDQFRRLQLFTSQLSYLSRKICVCLHPHRHRHNHHHYPHHHHMPSSMRPPPFYIRADIQKRHLQYCTWHQQALFYSPINDFMI